jgi:hypothetical protein
VKAADAAAGIWVELYAVDAMVWVELCAIWGFWSLAVTVAVTLSKMDRSMPQYHVHAFAHLALAN